MGVVGAGGAGFPTYVKAASQVEYVLANGAECEPLVHKDVELMKAHPQEVICGLLRMKEMTGATRAIIGIKSKNKRAIAALEKHLGTTPIEMLFMGDFYPAGDEYELVNLATGRLIPPGGIPLQVGCVVNNVETLCNVERAFNGSPVTDKFVSVTGLVNEPKSFWTPVGTSFRDLLARAGGTKVSEFSIMVSGLMMGRLTFDLDEPVTKTVGGLIVLPADHLLARRYGQTEKSKHRIGKSACDQCSYCTELCPRYLLGYDILPHKVMRGLGFTKTGSEQWSQWAQFCCSCGLCTLYACPEDLFPREACDRAKMDMRAGGIKVTQTREVRVHPMKDARRVPLIQLRRRLEVEQYESEAPFDASEWVPEMVQIKLNQHVGKPAQPVVAPGDRVKKGTTVAHVDGNDLGVNIHASVSGVVDAVTSEIVQIRSGGRKK